MMTQPASVAWFARHEIGLAWRDWTAMMTGGRRTRGIVLGLVLVAAAAIMHLIAYGVVSSWLATGIGPDKPTLVMLTGGGLLFWSVMLSQALESVTRVYYARADLDLILSSPASAKRLFAVRTGAVALTTFAMSCLLASPLVNVLVLLDGPRWLAAFAVLAAISALSAAIAVAVTIALFHTVGAKRTRLIAQIIAAVVGAGFIIGIQAAAIIYYGKFSRFTLLQSSEIVAAAPDLANILWLPARAAMGDLAALVPVALTGFGALALIIIATASSLWSPRHFNRQCQPHPHRAPSRHPRLQERFAKTCPAPQGVETASARPMAFVANAHANPLSGAPRPDAVDQLWRTFRRLCRCRAGAGHGRGPIGRRPGVARYFWRRRPRSGGHRPDIPAHGPGRENRGGSGDHRHHPVAAHRAARTVINRSRSGNGDLRAPLGRLGHRHPGSGSGWSPDAPCSAAVKLPRALQPCPKPLRPSCGRALAPCGPRLHGSPWPPQHWLCSCSPLPG
ncbi:hypothetical protein PSQ19_08270 [Devosia algicola]|uniref:ABC transporter permease n=1 Tax=Devosia algicola TaxID=3026418 RepID=A0ABY7YSQ5_9HYPH|nr:hypothetical protein [Devosia algicola]WDR03999.1 hypothetical protein PSQ19_08270 [Devosia algicola]